MLFQTYYRLDPWDFEPPLRSFAGVQFDVPDEKFSLYMRCEYPQSEDERSVLLIQTLHRRSEVPDDVAHVFAGRVDIDLFPTRQDGLGSLPESYGRFVRQLHSEMDRIATDLFNVIRWRLGVVGGPLMLSSDLRSMRWHDPTEGDRILDKHGFLNRQIRAGIVEFDLPDMQGVAFDNECRVHVEELFQYHTRQPLYHDLFREAWQNKSTNARSALVMAIAAAETGFKIAASDLNPSIAWMLENLPSPPLDKMIREFLVQLPTRRTFQGQVLRPPNAVITTLKTGIELRNKLVHGRVQEVESDTLSDILIAVRDFLYLLDYYRGHDWALEQISPPVLDMLRSR